MVPPPIFVFVSFDDGLVGRKPRTSSDDRIGEMCTRDHRRLFGLDRARHS